MAAKTRIEAVKAEHTGLAARKKAAGYRASLRERLVNNPGDFTFAQATRMIVQTLHMAGVNDPSGAILYKVNPNLSFPPRDIEKIEFAGEGGGTRAEITMNLMGLHGSASPLPSYFTEHVAKYQDEPDALRDFLDIFNHRLLSLLYGTWTKYRYYFQYKDGATDSLSQRFLGFIGLGYEDTRSSGKLDLSRLLAYAGLIAFKGDAAGSLESTLRHYFSHPDVTVISCMRRTVHIHDDQLTRLGRANTRLSEDCILGSSLQDQTGKFRISIKNLDWERCNSFLPDTVIFTELSSLVRFVLRSRLQFDVELRLKPEEIKPFKIGKNSVNRLGWSTWLGDTGDGVVVLESS